MANGKKIRSLQIEKKILDCQYFPFKFLVIPFLFLETKMFAPRQTSGEAAKCHMTRFGPVMSSDVLLGLFPPSAQNWFNDDFQEP